MIASAALQPSFVLPRNGFFVKNPLRKIEELIKKIGIVYTSELESIRHQNKSGEFVSNPMGVAFENVWISYGTSSTATVTAAPANVPNSCLVFCVVAGAVSSATATWLGANMTLVNGTNSGSSAAYMYQKTSPGAVSGVCSLTLNASATWRAFVIQFSGVNQATPIYNQNALSSSSVTTSSLSVTSTPFGALVDCIYCTTGATASNGQTPIAINSFVSGGLRSPQTSTSDISSYGFTSTSVSHIAASMNPA